jgi:hypothetical protein
VDNSVDKAGDDVSKVTPCKAFSCAAYFLPLKIFQIKQEVDVSVKDLLMASWL